jgi:hypothetical protein
MSRAVWVVGFALLALVYYLCFGPAPTPSEAATAAWYAPRGLLVRSAMLAGLRDLARDETGALRLVPVLLFSVPPLALLAAGFRLTRSALERACGMALALSSIAFVYYGYLADGVWRFFEWRWPAVTLCTALVVAVLLYAPSLLRSALAAPPLRRAALLALPFALATLLFTEITGTNPDLTANLSPWPLVTLFGLLLVGRLLGLVHLAAGIGEWLSSRFGGALGVLASALVAVAAAVAAAPLVVSDAFASGAGLVVIGAVLASVYALVARRRARDPAAAAGDGRLRVFAGAVALAAIALANTTAESYQREARDVTSAAVISALESYRGEHGSYPDALEDLVPQYLPEVPHPRMGLLPNSDEVYTYSNFGDSFALEFSSVLWVQCAYSPPYAGEYAGDEGEEGWQDESSGGPLEEEEGADPGSAAPDVAAGAEAAGDAPAQVSESLAASWTCDSQPPRLW